MQPFDQQRQQQPSTQNALENNNLEINARQQQQQQQQQQQYQYQYPVEVKALEVPTQNPHKRIAATKIKEIDDQLDHGIYRCFFIYMIICFTVGVGCVILNLVGTTKPGVSVTSLWLTVLAVIWFMLQYVFEILAFRKRRLGLANIAIFLFVINFFLLVLVVALLAANYQSFSYYNPGADDELYRLVKKVLLGLIIYFAVLLGLQLFINLPGSIKTRKLLKSRRSYEIASL